MPYQENREFQSVLEEFDQCAENGQPFAIFRKPDKKKVIAVIQKDSTKYELDFNTQGFVFAPFNWADNALLIKADKVVCTEYLDSSLVQQSTRALSEKGRVFHINLVQKAIDEIEVGSMEKVVLSRKIEEPFNQSPFTVFETLLKSYGSAFCYLIYHPQFGFWCGATPESLVQIADNRIETMALAGTLPYISGISPQWGTKEIVEQEMVSTYILDQLSDITDSLTLDKVESVRAGNLWHLKSSVHAVMAKDTTIGQVVSALHPTPAVCGIPTAKAKAFINANEGYDRKFYTGFLGEINISDPSDIALYVNLRCMKLERGIATLFVGGGITDASEPEKEWIETQNKSRTMLNILVDDI